MVLLSGHTTTTAAEALADAEVGLLPTGSTEQHGPALPLSTDFTAAAALARSLDREDALDDAEAGGSESWGRSVHGASVGFDTADFSASGAVGTPTDASAEAGERIFDAASDHLDALVDWLADQRYEDLRPEPHR